MACCLLTFRITWRKGKSWFPLHTFPSSHQGTIVICMYTDGAWQADKGAQTVHQPGSLHTVAGCTVSYFWCLQASTPSITLKRTLNSTAHRILSFSKSADAAEPVGPPSPFQSPNVNRNQKPELSSLSRKRVSRKHFCSFKQTTQQLASTPKTYTLTIFQQARSWACYDSSLGGAERVCSAKGEGFCWEVCLSRTWCGPWEEHQHHFRYYRVMKHQYGRTCASHTGWG